MPRKPTDEWNQETVNPEDLLSETGFALWIVRGATVEIHDLPARGVVSIGRAPDNDLVIADPTISRRHCTLQLGPTVSVVADASSRSGVKLRDTRLEPGAITPLQVGDALSVGGVAMILQRRTVADETGSPPEHGADVDALVAQAFGDRVARDERMRQVIALAARIAPTSLNVLILGPTGTGKEHLAEAIHRLSPRASRPLLKLNCATMGSTLLESELFGHAKGAFTGALSAKPGLLETADGGTVLLDEVADLPMDTQAKLLRVIEDGKVARLGSVESRTLDVRFVAATHRDLPSAVERGEFRRDLYYRINGFTLQVPALFERPDDIVPLIEHFAARVSPRGGSAFTPEALASMRAHDWPGNVRELKNVVERALALAGDQRVTVQHLPPELTSSTRTAQPFGARPTLVPAAGPRSDERQRIIDALAATHGNQTKAAELLGMPRRTFNKRLLEFNIPGPRGGRSGE